ncbi:MAG: hypothetical protein U9O82_07530, partial [Thermodesulfobacteriota bacterium]|nr:hypothetical protein [Thermodesulfobacteriota bacterium]
IRVMRIYEIAWSPSQKGDTDKQVCPCHPSPIASPKSVIIRKYVTDHWVAKALQDRNPLPCKRSQAL